MARTNGKRLAKAPFPGFIVPALAGSRVVPPRGAKWLHEMKLDGYRLQVHIQAGEMRLFTRRGFDWTSRFGRSIPHDLRALPVKNAIIDGEIVFVGEDGLPSFAGLQEALATGRTERIVYYAFDLLYLDGRDLRTLPLVERKDALAAIVNAPGRVRYTEHFDNAEALFRLICAVGAEGIVSKWRDGVYQSGRSKLWIKVKCVWHRDFVIAGYLPLRRGAAVGALVIGYYDKDELLYAGRIGTGFTEAMAEMLYSRLEAIRTPKSPFASQLPRVEARGVRFVRPELVAEVALRGWTRDKTVRAASFRRLREDKDAREITLEGKERSAIL